MRQTGKLDYLEMPATGGTLDRVKAFYSAAFSWSFTDYGPTYAAFSEGLDGGFDADREAVRKTAAGSLFGKPRGHDVSGRERRRQDREADLLVSRRTPLPFHRSSRQ